MRVAFFASPAFALPVLEAVRTHFKVVLVVTQPDKPVGRGLKLTAPPVAARAHELNLPLAQPARLRRNTEFEEQLRASSADVAVTCAYGKILPASLLAVPKHGFLNTHTSLLPRLRGAAPIQWALIHGETVTGTTIMQTDEGMDTGPVLLQEPLPIAPHWTSVELSHALAQQASGLIVRALREIETLTPQAQNDAEATHAPLLSKEDGVVRWQESAAAVYNRFRGVYAWPGTTASWGSVRVKLNALRPTDGQGEGGEVIGTREGLIVACGEGAVEVLALQSESKKSLPALEWWRGVGGKIGERFA
ncbi:methionyl-tRNA formyltransferase [Deinococcus peraridilitoris]|uniref:Methionyl-tRNA formyltransferase n=1 Tax=Deinococcus peraridilitoris (strain DSM 19664 / LMG 22246 / CIP 109416 / KR-200) TaxID=937777 RepID=L0A3U8_DEIPD|nr:methionyl-tRNA formyltransferase [Deinococcus peraridilitoris]AFZ67867.1 methionyl-tRNA formyltransferase [Deinococcus peraridilitoris DSM 19664]